MALADLTTGLARRIEDLVPVVSGLAGRAGQTGRHDLEDRVDRAVDDCTQLRDRTSRPLASRRDVDAAGAQVAALTAEVGGLQSEIDALLPPGHQLRS